MASAAFRRSFAARLPFARTTFVQRPSGLRAFQSCSRLAVGKESKLHDETRPEEVEKLKQAQLEKVKQTGQGEYHDELATESESDIKADRGEQENSNESIEELQRDTAAKAEREYKNSS